MAFLYNCIPTTIIFNSTIWYKKMQVMIVGYDKILLTGSTLIWKKAIKEKTCKNFMYIF